MGKKRKRHLVAVDVQKSSNKHQCVVLSEEDKKVLDTLKQDLLLSSPLILSDKKEMIHPAIELEINRFKGTYPSYVREINGYRRLMFDYLFEDRATEGFEFSEFCRLINNRKNKSYLNSICLSDEEKEKLQKLKKGVSLNDPSRFLRRKTVVNAVIKLECLHFKGESTVSAVAIQKFRSAAVHYLLQDAFEEESFKIFSISVSKEKTRLKVGLKKLQKISNTEKRSFRKRRRGELSDAEIKRLFFDQKEVEPEGDLSNQPQDFLDQLDDFLVGLENFVNLFLQQDAVQFFHFVDRGFFVSANNFFSCADNTNEAKAASLFSVFTNLDRVLQQLLFMKNSGCSSFVMDNFPKIEKDFSLLREQSWVCQNESSDIFSAFSSEEAVKKIGDQFNKSDRLMWRITAKKEQIMRASESQAGRGEEENLSRQTVSVM